MAAIIEIHLGISSSVILAANFWIGPVPIRLSKDMTKAARQMFRKDPEFYDPLTCNLPRSLLRPK
jgi:hypothetical protein